jgi:hypothetical protein
MLHIFLLALWIIDFEKEINNNNNNKIIISGKSLALHTWAKNFLKAIFFNF